MRAEQMDYDEMHGIKQYMRFEEILVVVAYCMYMFASMLSYSYFAVYTGDLSRPIGKVCFGLLILKEVLSLLSDPELDIMVIVADVIAAFLFIISQKNGYGLSVSLSFMFAIASRDVDIRRVIKVCIVVTAICLSFVIICSLLGIIKNIKINQRGRQRQYLGFNYALVPAAFLSNIVMGSFYYYQDKISWNLIIVLMAATVYVYTCTDSRMAFYCSMSVLVVAIVLKYRPDWIEYVKHVSPIMVASFIICLALTLFIIHRYNVDPSSMAELDEKVGRRITFASRALNQTGYRLLGTDFNMIGNGGVNSTVTDAEYSYIDNAYAQMIVKLGVLATAIITIVYTKALKKSVEIRDWHLLVCLFVVALYCLLDDNKICVETNFAIPVMGRILINRDDQFEGNTPIYRGDGPGK